MSDLTKTTLLNLLSHALFGAPLEIPDGVDWQAVFDESKLQSVSAIAIADVPSELFPESVAKAWEEESFKILMNNSRVGTEHAQVHRILTSAHIPYVILKGCASASYYPDPMMRSMGDVDFLINKSDIGKADLLLRKNGYQPQPGNHECERGYRKGLSTWELHWAVNGVPGGEVGDRINGYLADIIPSVVLTSSVDGEYMAPTDFNHGLVMLLHVARHMVTGGIGLRHLCDWAVFAAKVGEDFPSVFEEKLRAVGLWRFAQLLTQLSVNYLKCPPQSWMGELESELIAALKDDVFAAGNFGAKDEKRKDEAKFITSRKKGGVNDDSTLKQSILSANEIVRKHWKFADRIPVVYPAGWAFFGGRYAIRSALGKRDKKDVKALAKSANGRKIIYKQIKMFDISISNRK